MMLMSVLDQLDLAAHVELGSRDAGPDDALGPDVFGPDGQAAQGAAHVVERNARVEERAKDHVATDTSETIEVKSLHLFNQTAAVSRLLFRSKLRCTLPIAA